uniref:Uncharacterized protein n=1 Tax=Anguilla anguilla TaxID=7936 RepID=A0A0E9WKD9_ANGAN
MVLNIHLFVLSNVSIYRGKKAEIVKYHFKYGLLLKLAVLSVTLYK